MDAGEASLPWEGARGSMVSVDNPLGDIYSLKIAIERLLSRNIWMLVLWGKQKMQEKGGFVHRFCLKCCSILSFPLFVFLVLLKRWVLKQGWKDAELCLPTK